MLGENICKYRKKKGLSQEELAERIGVTRQTISNWELNETSPNTKQLKSLREILDVSVDCLLGNEIKPQKEENHDGKRSFSSTEVLVESLSSVTLTMIAIGGIIFLIIAIVMTIKEIISWF